MALRAPTAITGEHDLTGFDCGKPELNDWLKNRSLTNEKIGVSRTFVLCDEQVVVGYYCLSSATLVRENLPKSLRHGRPAQIPGALIGRLGVHRDPAYRGKGLGIGLARDAFKKIVQASHLVGMMVLIVDAMDDEAKAFWLKHLEMKELNLSDDPYRLYLPMATVEASLAANADGDEQSPG